MSSILLKINYDDQDNLSYKLLKNIFKDIKNILTKKVKKDENIFLKYSIKKID